MILQQKLVAEQAFLEVKTEQQRERKCIPMPNLTRLEYKGMLRVAKGIKEEGWHLSETDKSSRLVLDRKENYVAQLLKHTEGDLEVSMEDVSSNEGLLYDHVSALTRVFGFGNGLEGERDRIRESMKPTF